MSTSRKKYLIKNTAIFALGSFGTKFISFFLVPLYTNILTTSEYGTVDMISTIGMVLVPLLTLNICEAVMRFSLDENADLNKIISVGICSLFLAIFAGGIIFPVTAKMKSLNEYAVYVYMYAVSLAFSQMFLCYLRGKELLLRYSIGNIIQTFCVALFNILFLVQFDKGIKGYLLAYIIANFVTAMYAMVAGNVFNAMKHFSIDSKLFVQMVKYAIVLVPNSFMWWIMNSSDRVMVTAMVGVAANGIYAVAYKIPTLLSSVTQVFNQAWSYSAIREEGSLDEEKYNNDIYNRLVAIVCICAAGLMMVMKVFLRYYVGAEYYIAWKYTPVLIIGFVFSTLGTFAATAYTVHKDSMGYLVSGTAGAIVNIILNFALIPQMGAMGAAFATAASYFIVFYYRIRDTKKYLKLYIWQKRHIFAGTILLVQAITMFINNPVGQLLLILEFCIMILIYVNDIKQLFFAVTKICRLKNKKETY